MIYSMTRLDEYEIRAFDKASEEAGKYLDETIGKTDLADMTEDEWRLFLKTVVIAHREAMREELKEAPF